MNEEVRRLLSRPTDADRFHGRCPICSCLVGQCSHLTKRGKLKPKASPEHVQEQKYAINYMWRGGKRRNQGER